MKANYCRYCTTYFEAPRKERYCSPDCRMAERQAKQGKKAKK